MNINDKIIRELSIFKFRRNSMAYEYLIEAIKLVAGNKNSIKDFESSVYFPISKKYNTKPQNVMWCLNKLISLVYLNTNLITFKNYFNLIEDEKITTKAFIIGVSRKVVEKE